MRCVHLWPLLAALTLTAGCQSGKFDFGDDTGGDGGEGDDGGGDDGGVDPDEWAGEEEDSRLIVDIVTWPCGDQTNDTYYLGAYAMTATLEFAPDHLEGLELPEPGQCISGVSMFPLDAGNEGADVSGKPRWNTGWDSGPMQRRAPGFYEADILGNQPSCQATDELLASGLEVEEAGELTGVTGPAAGELEAVTIEDAYTSYGLEFGSEFEIGWSASGWQTSWVQIRQERDGYAYGNVICNTTGESSFFVDSDVWGLLDPELSVEVINLYVGFQNQDVQELSSGIQANVLTRAMYVGVIID